MIPCKTGVVPDLVAALKELSSERGGVMPSASICRECRLGNYCISVAPYCGHGCVLVQEIGLR